jgi:hypothetical protein
MLMPESTANIWLSTKPLATSDLDGRNHLQGEKQNTTRKTPLAAIATYRGFR